LSTFPGSPRTLQGAIVGLDPFNPLASIVVFQYNPERLQRSIQPATPTGATSGGAAGSARAEALRLRGAPVETITVEVEIDATDQLAGGDPLATTLGITPQLSALEMLLYPKSALVIANTALLLAGTIEIIAPEAPLTLFIWGPQRVLPVRLTTLSVTEEAFDVSLNPIRARASMGLRVLTYSDLPVTHAGYYLFLAHQIIKEGLATVASIGAATGGLSGSIAAVPGAAMGTIGGGASFRVGG
jgi:hypothetical protein